MQNLERNSTEEEKWVVVVKGFVFCIKVRVYQINYGMLWDINDALIVVCFLKLKMLGVLAARLYLEQKLEIKRKNPDYDLVLYKILNNMDVKRPCYYCDKPAKRVCYF